MIVAFSGGVDSAYLAVRAHLVLGDRALAVTADSASLPEAERASALEVRGALRPPPSRGEDPGVRGPRYLRNDQPRCYRCKGELFRQLVPLAARDGFAHVAYGLIADDLDDFRPGQRAAAEAGMRRPRSPMPGFTKDEVRELSRRARPAHLGSAGVALPFVADPLRDARSPRRPCAGGTGRGGPARPRLLRVPRAPPGRPRPASRSRPGELSRLRDPALREAASRAVAAAGYAEVRAGRRGLSAGATERGLACDRPRFRLRYHSASETAARWRPLAPAADLGGNMFGLGFREMLLIFVDHRPHLRHEPHPRARARHRRRHQEFQEVDP